MQSEYHSNSFCAKAVSGLKKLIFEWKLLTKNRYSVFENLYDIAKHITVISMYRYFLTPLAANSKFWCSDKQTLMCYLHEQRCSYEVLLNTCQTDTMWGWVVHTTHWDKNYVLVAISNVELSCKSSLLCVIYSVCMCPWSPVKSVFLVWRISWY